LLFLALLAAPARAALDPETEIPYHLRVVVQITEHPFLTPVFKDKLRREIHDSLQDALRDMAAVEVVDKNNLEQEKAHIKGGQAASVDRTLALLHDVEIAGLQKALDSWKEISAVKTHFVLLDFHDHAYHIHTRQFDGTTGLPSPVVRTARVADRSFVGRVAALLIEQDFGIVGTALPGAGSSDVQVALKAGALAGSLDRWVQKGDVFYIAAITQDGQARSSSRVHWAVLQVAEPPKESVCHCRLLARYQNSLGPAPWLEGYRCLKLGTGTTQLRIRFLDEKNLNPLPSLRVTVSSDDLSTQAREEGSSNAEGLFQSTSPFQHLAFVRVWGSGSVPTQLPIPILDERTIICRVGFDPSVEIRGLIERDAQRFIERLYERLAAAEELFKELTRLVADKEHEQALQKTQDGIQKLQGEAVTLRLELATIRGHAREAGSAQIDFAEPEQLLRELDNRKARLEEYAGTLENVMKRENDPTRAKVAEMAKRAELAESSGEFDNAIQTYEKVLQEGKDVPGIEKYKEHLGKLKNAWAVKNDDHRKARAFFVQTWPNLKAPADLKDQLPQAQKMLQVCIASSDRLTPVLFLKGSVIHSNMLLQRLQALSGANGSVAEAQMIIAVQKDLAQLRRQAADFVRSQK
jgi:hypothetical protein